MKIGALSLTTSVLLLGVASAQDDQPGWCATIGDEAKKFIRECGGDPNMMGPDGKAVWCADIPADAKQYVLECCSPDCNLVDAETGADGFPVWCATVPAAAKEQLTECGGDGMNADGFPVWCDNLGDDAKKYVTECGGKISDKGEDGYPLWCSTLSNDARRWIDECGGNSSTGVLKADAGGTGTSGASSSTGAFQAGVMVGAAAFLLA